MPAIDLELACNLIQQKIAANLAGSLVTTVPTTTEAYLTSLHDALCPYVMTWPGQGSFYQKGGGYKIDDRRFIVTCFVESLAQKDIPTRTHQGIQILQAMRNLFVTASTIPLATGDYQITIQSWEGNGHNDSGLSGSLRFGGVFWFGFQIQLNAQVQWII